MEPLFPQMLTTLAGSLDLSLWGNQSQSTPINHPTEGGLGPPLQSDHEVRAGPPNQSYHTCFGWPDTSASYTVIVRKVILLFGHLVDFHIIDFP